MPPLRPLVRGVPPPSANWPPGATRALLTIGIFSLLMVTCPIGLYFGSYNGYFDGLYALTFGIPNPEWRAVASAMLAVLGVNIVVGGFLYIAFNEVTDDSDKPKVDAKKKD